MTFNKAALAIDGARVTSSLVRLGTYVSTGGDKGVAAAPDLKVTPLEVAGNGVQIAAGGALLLNDYMGASPTQSYVVENPDVHIFGSSDMPSVSASERYFVLAIVVGDPEFTQVNHPFMPSQMTPGTETTFAYVRPVLFPANSGSTGLPNMGYPALPLARIRIKANSATITADDIFDLRDLARPRTKVAQGIVQATGAADTLNQVSPAAAARFPNLPVLTLTIPTWASTVKVTGYVEGLRLDKAGAGYLRPYAYVGATVIGVGGFTNIDEYVPARQKDRRSYNVAGSIAIPAQYRGQTVSFAVQGLASNTASKDFLVTDGNTSVALTAFFEEALI